MTLFTDLLSPRNENLIFYIYIYIHIVLNKKWKNLLVRIKFYWSWAGGPLFIVGTVFWTVTSKYIILFISQLEMLPMLNCLKTHKENLKDKGKIKITLIDSQIHSCFNFNYKKKNLADFFLIIYDKFQSI